MDSIAKRLLDTASRSRDYLDNESKQRIVRFVRSRWNQDGGVYGRDSKSDLYYTMFGVSCLRSLGVRPPMFKLWKYLSSLKNYESFSFVHLFCYARLRTLFPVTPNIRRQIYEEVEKRHPDTAYELFLGLLAQDYVQLLSFPDIHLGISKEDSTANIAASLIVNRLDDDVGVDLLLTRCCRPGGFCAGTNTQTPDILSTAFALFALHILEINLDTIRRPCLEFVESLWRENGGFSGDASDHDEDVEYTAYALLSFGCLMD